MNGLLQQSQQPAPEAEMPQEQQAPEQGGAQEATPEEQAQYDDLVTRALEIMYGEATHEAVVQRMKSMSDNVPAAIGTLAANLARAGVQEIRQKGGTVDDEIVAYAGFEIVAELIDLAQALKLLPPDGDTEDVGHKAMYVAIRMYTELADKAGELTEEDKANARQFLEQNGGQNGDAQAQPQ